MSEPETKPGFDVETDPSKCWNCGCPVAVAEPAKPAPSVAPDLLHVLTTVLAVGGYIALKRYGIDAGEVSDILAAVGGASLWGHAKQAAIASAYRQQESNY